MTYDASRTFGRNLNKRCWAVVICLVIGITICNFFEPYILNFKFLAGDNLNLQTGITKERIEAHHQPCSGIKERSSLVCELTRKKGDFCDMKGDLRILGNSSTIFMVSNEGENLKTWEDSWHIKPYARKEDSIAMGRVRTIRVRKTEVSKGSPICSRNYNNPAVLFSTGGYTRNHFHTFADILIPLYLTSIEFQGEVRFLITDMRPLWIEKHQDVLLKLSNYQLIDIDQEKEILCFPRIILGLKATDKELGINASQSSYTMKEFRQFLRNTYSLKKQSAIRLPQGVKGKRLRLLLVSRKKTRRLLNEGEVAVMAEGLGFDVLVEGLDSFESNTPELATEPRVAQLVNSVDVLLGVHGAGLANMVFLPENAVVIQIVPLGEMEWMARTFFEEPARDMNLRHLEYRISPDESTITQQFPEILKEAEAVKKKGWRAFRTVFMDKQDINVNISRFRNTLLKAYAMLES